MLLFYLLPKRCILLSLLLYISYGVSYFGNHKLTTDELNFNVYLCVYYKSHITAQLQVWLRPMGDH